MTTATNSNEPVFDGDWLDGGTHVNTMIGSDYFLPRRETDEKTVLKSRHHRREFKGFYSDSTSSPSFIHCCAVGRLGLERHL